MYDFSPTSCRKLKYKYYLVFPNTLTVIHLSDQQVVPPKLKALVKPMCLCQADTKDYTILMENVLSLHITVSWERRNFLIIEIISLKYNLCNWSYFLNIFGSLINGSAQCIFLAYVLMWVLIKCLHAACWLYIKAIEPPKSCQENY